MAVEGAYFFLISSMKPLAMNPTMMSTIMTTMTQAYSMGMKSMPVSYTHLTLPTKLEV